MKIKVILLTMILLLSFSTVVFAGDIPDPTPTPPPETPTPPPPPDEGDEWCSPGYWRNHLDSWTEQDVKYSVIGSVTLSKLGVRRAMTTDPTLLQVLQGPQYYGGAAYNAVADYLSGIHVDFDGTRVPGSCPLN